MDQWANYFIATAGAAAALTGLIFVSVSLNLKRILSVTHLPGRALGSLMLLTNILIISSFCLIPKQSLFFLGCEIIVAGILTWFAVTSMNRIKNVEQPYKNYHFQNIFFTQLAVIPFAVSGVFLLCGYDTGLYWLIPGISFSFIKALSDSWVLLVEINR